MKSGSPVIHLHFITRSFLFVKNGNHLVLELLKIVVVYQKTCKLLNTLELLHLLSNTVLIRLKRKLSFLNETLI